jgi:hypothetical protein
MEIKKLNKEQYVLWNEFVTKSKQGSIFSKTWYLDALQVEYKIIVIIEKKQIKCGIILPKNEIKTYSNPMLDKYLGVLLELPSGNYQKVVSKQYKYQKFLISELRKIKSFDYFFHPNYHNWIPFYWKGFTQQTKYTYRINLYENSIDSIYKRFHSNLRNDIINAEKNNVIIESNIDINQFYDIINKTYLRQGSKAPFSLQKIHHFISQIDSHECIKLFGAKNNLGELMAVCCLVYDKTSSYLILNGIDIEKQIRGANALLIFESIKFFHGKCKYFDFEGSMLPGVEQFYRRFGGELTSYYRIWNDNFFNYLKSRAKKFYKKLRYGR